MKIIAAITGRPASQSPVLHTGDPVKKGQLLVQLDNSDLFLKLRAEKKTFKEELLNNQPKIPKTDSAAFSAFVLGMNPNGLLPRFPKLSLQSLQILNAQKLLDRYDAMATKEAAMQDYFVFSPVNGRIGSVNSSGEIEKGSVLMTLFPEGFTISPPVRGKPGTKISLADSTGKMATVIIQSQSAKATCVSGNLKAGKYALAGQ